MTRKSTNAMKIFEEIKTDQLDRNYFDFTHDVKMTGLIGKLMPILCFPTLPGDIIDVSFDTLVRFPPAIAPVMHRFDMYIHTFFVPNRIVWSGWEKFISKHEEAGTIPQITLDNTLSANHETFLDYFGIPPYSQSPQEVDENIQAIPFGAYQMIYNEYYRAQQIINPVPFEMPEAGGVLSTSDRNDLLQLRTRAWEHDYFTSCLPTPQIGDAANIPFGDVELKSDWASPSTNNPAFRSADMASTPEGTVMNDGATFPGNVWIDGPITDQRAAYDPSGTLRVAATTINALRESYAMQRFLELVNRSGQRYYEFVRAVWGETPSDARLQRPEYITGTQAPVIISEILNQTSITGEDALGTQGGHLISFSDSYKGKFACEDYGHVIAIMSVVPKPAYMQGIHREWTKTDPYEFGVPQFANIGEQAVLKKEMYAFSNDGADEFGYIPRFSEYKYMPSRVAGEFRTNLDAYQCARSFASPPALNQTFIEVPDNIANHIFAVNSYVADQLWINVLNNLNVARKLPMFSNPI